MVDRDEQNRMCRELLFGSHTRIALGRNASGGFTASLDWKFLDERPQWQRISEAHDLEPMGALERLLESGGKLPVTRKVS